MRLSRYLGNRDFWRYALRLALPVAAQNLMPAIFSLFSMMMLSTLELPGHNVVAAVGLGGRLSFFLFVALFGFSSGTAVFISQYWGARDIDGIHRVYGFAGVCTLGMALAFTLVGLLAPEFVIGLFSGSEETIGIGASYLRIVALGFVGSAISSIAGIVLAATENVKLPMAAGIAAGVCTVGLNALFILGLDMGVMGAALAGAISAWISPVILYTVAIVKKNLLIAPLKKLTDWSGAFIAHYFKYALPVILNEITWAAATLLNQSMISRANEDFYTALTLFSSIEGFSAFFLVGLCHATTVMVGKRVGAGDIEAAIEDGRRFAILVPLIAAAIGLVLIALRNVLPLLFMDSSETARSMLSNIILIVGLVIAMRNLPYISIVGIFRAGGDTRAGFWIDGICLWLISVPITFVTINVLHLPIVLAYVCMAVGEDFVKCILCVRHFISRKWIRPVTAPPIPMSDNPAFPSDI